MSPFTLEMSRRDILAGGAAAAGAFGLGASTVPCATELAGNVYEELPGGERRGLAGAQVTNGLDIALSDREGRWRLPVRLGEHVFVIKPDDFAWPVALDSALADAHEIGGSPARPNHDFLLRRKPEPRRFDVALLADTQPESEIELGYLRDSVLPAVIETRPAFAINHGDIVSDRPDLYSRYRRLIASAGFPWHHCPGNHDMDHGPAATCFETWKRTFGPCHSAFHYGGATFILLNNVERPPDGKLTPAGYNYRGAIGAAQLAWVRRSSRRCRAIGWSSSRCTFR